MVVEILHSTGATAPRPDLNEVNAKLAEILVDAMELDSRHLRAYGEVSAEASAYLEAQSRRLTELAMQLVDRTQQPP